MAKNKKNKEIIDWIDKNTMTLKGIYADTLPKFLLKQQLILQNDFWKRKFIENCPKVNLMNLKKKKDL